MPQVGIVQIDDDVEIGACNTIDRATFGKTWIKAGVKTDNQVHIAHNVTVGEHTAIAAQVGIDAALINYALGVNAFADQRYDQAKNYLLKAKELDAESYTEKCDSLLQRIKVMQ